MSAAGDIDPAIRQYRMADYVELLAPAAAERDDIWCLRLILNEFGHFFCYANTAEREILVGAEPEPFDRRWDAFLAGYTEFLCAAAGLQAPAWALEPGRYLDEGWVAGCPFPDERQWRIDTTPPQFAAHGVYYPAEHLLVDGVAVVNPPTPPAS